MKIFITLTVIVGWLMVELKEFYKDGGFANTLAMDLLRISMAMILLLTISGFIFLSNVFSFILKLVDNKGGCIEAGMPMEGTKRVLKTKSFYLFDQQSGNEEDS